MNSEASPSPAPEKCPKCGKPNMGKSDTCSFCGIVFQRYAARAKRVRSNGGAAVKRRYASLGIGGMRKWSRFFGNLGRMVRSGVSLVESLQLLAGPNDDHRGLVIAARDQIERGETLCKAFEKAGAAWPATVWAHLEAGELSGRLPELCDVLAADLEARRKWILGQIFNFRTIYFFILLLGGAFSLAVSGSVGDLTNETVDQGSGAVLRDLVLGSIAPFIFYILLFAGGVFGFIWFQLKGKQMLTERFDWFEEFRLKLPFFSRLTAADELSRYFALMATMLESGLTIYKALEVAATEIRFPRWRRTFDRIADALRKGESLYEGYRKVPHMPHALLREIRIGEADGALDSGLKRYVENLKDEITRSRIAVNGMMFLVMFVAGAIFTVLVAARGIGVWVSLYERVLGI